MLLWTLPKRRAGKATLPPNTHFLVSKPLLSIPLSSPLLQGHSSGTMLRISPLPSRSPPLLHSLPKSLSRPSLPPLRSSSLHQSSSLADLPSPLTTTSSNQESNAGGPVELPPSSSSTIFAVDDNPSPLQTATSVLLTGAITVFLFRSLRRRARRAKELVSPSPPSISCS